MKTLTTKRVYLYAIHRSLKDTPPKEFPTTEEIKTTIEVILPKLKEVAAGFIDLIDAVDEVNKQQRKNKLNEKAAGEKRLEVSKEFDKYNDEHGEDLVSVEFEDEHFKVLQEQFDRDGWGQTFLNSIEDYNELNTAFEEVSSETEKKKK